MENVLLELIEVWNKLHPNSVLQFEVVNGKLKLQTGTNRKGRYHLMGMLETLDVLKFAGCNNGVYTWWVNE